MPTRVAERRYPSVTCGSSSTRAVKQASSRILTALARGQG